MDHIIGEYKLAGFFLHPSVIFLLLAYTVLSLHILKTPVKSTVNPSLGRTSVERGSRSLVVGDFRVFQKITGPESIGVEFFAFSASGQGLHGYLFDRYGIECNLTTTDGPRGAFEACIRRHVALFYGDYVVDGGTTKRPFAIPQCDSIGLGYEKTGKAIEGDVGGSQGFISIRGIPYKGQSIDFLVKAFKKSETSRPGKERNDLSKLVFISEDPKNLRRNDKGPYFRETDALSRLPPSPYFIAPVCFWDNERAILYPYYGAGDMIPLVEDEDILRTINDKVFKRIAKQIIEAVYLMHNAGITHMDIKPENIIIGGRTRDSRLSFFLDENSKVRLMIIDYGLCIKSDDFRGLGCIKAGTKVTMSPEQLMCHRPLSPACDWWGVAATLWRMRVMWDPEMDDEARSELLVARDYRWQHPVIKSIESFGADFNELIDEMLQLYPEYRQFDSDMNKLNSMKYLQ